MAKSKNHTSKNQNSKAHRNGIKRPQKFSFKRLTGVSIFHKLKLNNKCLEASNFRKKLQKSYKIRPNVEQTLDGQNYCR